jgi:hypothetical protein
MAYWGVHFASGDSLEYFQVGRVLNSVAFDDTGMFLKLMLKLNAWDVTFPNQFNALGYIAPYWRSGGAWTIIKIQALLHFLTAGGVYTHALFFGALAALSTIFLDLPVLRTKRTLYILLLLWPGWLLWRCNMHKDALAFFCIAVLVRMLWEERWWLRELVLVCCAVLVLYIIRPWIGYLSLFFVVVKYHSTMTYTSVSRALSHYALAGILLLLVIIISPTGDRLLEYAQYNFLYFQEVVGRTDFPIDPLGHGWGGILSLVLRAPGVLFFAPFLHRMDWIPMWVTQLEGCIVFFLFLYGIALARKVRSVDALVVLLPFLCLGYGLMYAMFVDNAGALLRYRSVPFFFLGYWVVYLEEKARKREDEKVRK